MKAQTPYAAARSVMGHIAAPKDTGLEVCLAYYRSELDARGILYPVLSAVGDQSSGAIRGPRFAARREFRVAQTISGTHVSR
jgi:hypothetical protein